MRLVWFAALCSILVGAAPLTAENARWNVNLEERHVPEAYRGGWPNHSYFSSPEDWRALSIYQLITDRFSDGDPRNNELFAGGFDVRDMTYRHGGDFVGLTQKLNYIKGLGCRGIWISPVFQNGYNSYHQYSQQDFTLLDRRLGTLKELRELTNRAHELGLYVIVDMVMNHMSNEFFFEGHRFTSAPWRLHETSGREYLLRTRKSAGELHETPAGKQPYMDFWYNNTWDPNAQYPGTVYGQRGEAVVDQGYGTYPSSDFHHNGDLQDYYDPFQINYGKLYGTMDDLRLESQRVQAKYSAMSRALISSCDIDGFRVDTPMQVPLSFYKAWVPAVKAHAQGLGKKSFGIFGEFYVTPERYATMTGRGKDHAMYGVEEFIEGAQTMKGGIVYSYYWYMFTAFVYGKPEYADGFALAYEEESHMLDTYDEVSGQKRYAMWNFCNNHDNWRMQSMTSTAHFYVCLILITFWPGIPLHYAGDEQNFRTPGSALDGWAREELAASLAWQAVDPDQLLERDNFDMTSRNYLFVGRLNALRSAYFDGFGREECDRLETPRQPTSDVVSFVRGCTADSKVLVLANFHAHEWRSVSFNSRWPAGVSLQDAVEEVNPSNITVGAKGLIEWSVPPLRAFLFVPLPRRSLPPTILFVEPKHGAVLRSRGILKLRVRFDRPMHAMVAERVALDGHAGLFSCLDDTCAEVGASVLHETLCDGHHQIDAPANLMDLADGATTASFRSTFLVDRHAGVVSEPRVHERPGLICDHGRKLCHNAAGARWLRIRDATGNWTQWRPYEAQSEWRAVTGIGVLVQYHSQGSSSYIAGDCLLRTLLRCHSTWHHTMNLRGDFNHWGKEPDWPMRSVDHFTWATNFSIDTFRKAKFVPGRGWAQSYGVHPTRKLLYGLPLFDPRSLDFKVEPYRSGAEASRRWMLDRGHWTEHESMTTSAEFASDVWISHLCTPEPPPCPPPPSEEDGWRCYDYRQGENLDWCESVGTRGCVTYALQNFSAEMEGCGGCDCCQKQVTLMPKAEPRTCCILFNDLLLNYTITADLSQCAPRSVELAPSWVLASGSMYQGLQGRCEDPALRGAEAEEGEAVNEGSDVASCPEEEPKIITLVATLVTAGLCLLLLFCHSGRVYFSVVQEASKRGPGRTADPHAVTPEAARHVLFASIEHIVPERGVKCFTGDTGTFLEDFIKEHPDGRLSMVHPMLRIDYGHLDLYSELTIVVDGKLQTVEVFFMESELEGLQITWYFLRHELFLNRSEETLFPQPMSKINTLRFYSLWNQSLAMLLEGLKPEIYHSLDCHQAMAPFYMDSQIPMVLLLRNPWAMGAVEDSIGDRFWKTVPQMRRMSLVFNLKIQTIRKYCLFEGRFNMMNAGVRYIAEAQQGHGLCTLSCAPLREHRLLKSLQLTQLGHPSRPVRDEVESIEALKTRREKARAALQQHAGLTNCDAQVLLFVGPWARHAGVELIAEVLPQILGLYPQVQAILCGLCSDLFGVMSQDLLRRVMSAFPGRLCFLSERFELSNELRRGVHLLLSPHVAEPVGQMDVEMGFLGVPSVGLAGVLGRMPGIYFRQQNSDAEMLKCGFFNALDYALTMPVDQYWQLCLAGTCGHEVEADFGEPWQGNLLQVYDEVAQRFQGRPTDQERFDDRLWNNAASQEDLQSALGARRSSPLRPVSSTADLAHQMQVLDIDDDAEFLCQPVSESRAHEIMKAVAESLPYLTQIDARDLQRDISQARQRLQERNHMTRGLMKPFARGLCLRIHLIMAVCYVTCSPAEQLIESLEADGAPSLAPYLELWCAFYAAQGCGALFWLGLSSGIPPNLLMTASQGLSLMAFMLLPLLPEQTDWSCLGYAALSGVENSSRLLFILWNFNEEPDHGFQVAIWRLALLEGLRRSCSWLALLASYAEKLWIYKQVVFVISFISLVLLFKAPYCYAAHVLPSSRCDLPPSFILLLLSEVATALGGYPQDLRHWLEPNGWSPEELDICILGVVLALPLILYFTFKRLRRMQVWGPWALRDVACFLPSGTLLRALALWDDQERRSPSFVSAMLLSILMDALRYTAILSAMMTLLGTRAAAMKGCYVALSATAIASAAAPSVARLAAEKLSLEDELYSHLPWALWGYVFQMCAAYFFNDDVLSFKAHSAGRLRWSPVGQVRQRMRLAKAAVCKLQDRQQAEELALDQVQAVIEESLSALPSLLISPKGGGKQIWETPKDEPGEDEADKVPDEREGLIEEEEEKSGMPGKDSSGSKSMVSFTKTELPVPSLEESHEDKEGLTTPGVRSVRSQEALEGQSPSSSLDRVDEAELEEDCCVLSERRELEGDQGSSGAKDQPEEELVEILGIQLVSREEESSEELVPECEPVPN